MDLFHTILVTIKYGISLSGILVIMVGVVLALWQFIQFMVEKPSERPHDAVNIIRLRLGRILILGLEFIVAADLIGTITTPDYYDVGLLLIIVLIRSVLSYTINREIQSISVEDAKYNTSQAIAK